MPRGDKPTTVALALKDGWVYEDALPEMTKEQYDWWYDESLVLDGVRMGPPLTTRNHHGECPWCVAHPHREPCSSNCAAARFDKAALEAAANSVPSEGEGVEDDEV